MPSVHNKPLKLV